MSDLAFKLLLSGGFAMVIWSLVACAGHSIAWWLAALIALMLVFGGWPLIDGEGACD